MEKRQLVAAQKICSQRSVKAHGKPERPGSFLSHVDVEESGEKDDW